MAPPWKLLGNLRIRNPGRPESGTSWCVPSLNYLIHKELPETSLCHSETTLLCRFGFAVATQARNMLAHKILQRGDA